MGTELNGLRNSQPLAAQTVFFTGGQAALFPVAGVCKGELRMPKEEAYSNVLFQEASAAKAPDSKLRESHKEH